MIVYVESNFLLELSLTQDQSRSCAEIIGFCEQGKATLIIPAVCVSEAYSAALAKQRITTRLSELALSELAQRYSRSRVYRNRSPHPESFREMTADLYDVVERRLHEVLDRILSVAEIIPLDAAVIQSARNLRKTNAVSPFIDSLILASVLAHREVSREQSCFLSTNSKEFADPQVQRLLEARNCKVLFRFEAGRNYLIRGSE